MHDTPTSDERWLPVVGWEAFYLVSDHGRVRSLDRLMVHGRYPTVTFIKKGRLLRPKPHPYGYLKVSLCVDGRQVYKGIHTLVAEAFIGPRPPGGAQCCHDDGDPTNNHVSNLRWDTPSGNARDKRRHGTEWQVLKTMCPRRHPLAEPNLVAHVARRGHRNCLACKKAMAVIENALKRGRPVPDLQEESDRQYQRLVRQTTL